MCYFIEKLSSFDGHGDVYIFHNNWSYEKLKKLTHERSPD